MNMIPLLAGVALAALASRKGQTTMLDDTWRVPNWSHLKVDPALRQNANVRAFLLLIRKSEVGHKGDIDYQTLNGGATFKAPPWVHPNKIVSPGTSTAAGAFQIVKGTWDSVSKANGLTDFSPVSQEIAAIGLLGYRGALPDIMEGNLDAVFSAGRVGKEWDSLPGGGHVRYTNALLKVLFTGFGGKLNAQG